MSTNIKHSKKYCSYIEDAFIYTISIENLRFWGFYVSLTKTCPRLILYYKLILLVLKIYFLCILISPLSHRNKFRRFHRGVIQNSKLVFIDFSNLSVFQVSVPLCRINTNTIYSLIYHFLYFLAFYILFKNLGAEQWHQQ